MSSSCRISKHSDTTAVAFPALDTDRKASRALVQQRVQVLIVGLGPAGTACGMESAKSGLDVLAIDRAHFPRDNICGDALSGDALRFLRENNLECRCVEWRRSFKTMDKMIGGIDRSAERFVRSLLRSVMLR